MQFRTLKENYNSNNKISLAYQIQVSQNRIQIKNHKYQTRKHKTLINTKAYKPKKLNNQENKTGKKSPQKEKSRT